MNYRKMTGAAGRRVYDRTSGRCAFCGAPVAFEDMRVCRDDRPRPCSAGAGDVLLPICGSCRSAKRGDSVERWRRRLEDAPDVLARENRLYRMAARFGLVRPVPDRRVVFFFERTEKSSYSSPLGAGKVDF